MSDLIKSLRVNAIRAQHMPSGNWEVTICVASPRTTVTALEATYDQALESALNALRKDAEDDQGNS